MKKDSTSRCNDTDTPHKATVYLVGLGPGDPELLTLKGLRALQKSDYIFVPQSDKSGRSIAKNIVSHYISEDKIKLYHIPMTNNEQELTKRYSELAWKIDNYIQQGKSICYVTIGDPTIYSTANYLKERLNEREIGVSLVPAVSSCNAISCACGVSLCEKTENFGVYEAPDDIETVVTYIQEHSTVVFMKVNKKLTTLIKTIKKTSPHQAFLVKRIGLDNEEIYDLLKDTPPPEADYMSTVIIRR
jgi:precorrin-2/cobalt-factor-2 C20-methyltransferase